MDCRLLQNEGLQLTEKNFQQSAEVKWYEDALLMLM